METTTFNTRPDPRSGAHQFSANLLETWIRKREQEHRIRAKWSTTLMGIVVLSGLGSLGIVAAQTQTQAWADRELQALKRAKDEMQALGAAQTLAAGDLQMQDVPAQYKQRSDELLTSLVASLTSSDRHIGMETLTFTREKGTLIGKGTAKVGDLRSARQFLDRVQTKLPGTQGLITNVTQSTDPNQLGLSIQFELSGSQIGGPR